MHVPAHLVLSISGIVVARSQRDVVKTERLRMGIVSLWKFHRCLLLFAFVHQGLGLSNLDVAERKKGLVGPR